jgi:hypothetical protein
MVAIRRVAPGSVDKIWTGTRFVVGDESSL